MALAGRTAEAGRIPGQRIATTVETSDSSTFTTTETEVLSVTASLVEGRTYRFRFQCRFGSSVSDDIIIYRIRQDDTSGTTQQIGRFHIATSSGSTGLPVTDEWQYTATATGDKTIIVTGQRTIGSGNIYRAATTGGPSYFYCDYIEG